MQNDSFTQTKDSILNDRKDKSHEGKWDEHIIELCDKINSFDNYFTTSSCSGRIVLVKGNKNKSENAFLFKSHNIINFDVLKNSLINNIKEINVEFKQEPPILHVACKTLKDAQEIVDKARNVGFRRSGIQGTNEKFSVEICSTEKIEFPLIREGKVLVDDEFMKVVIEKANSNLEKGWEKIGRLKDCYN